MNMPALLPTVSIWRRSIVKFFDNCLGSPQYQTMQIRWQNPRILSRYWLMQIPGAMGVAIVGYVLEEFSVVSRSTWIWGLIAWTVKDAALYPFVWQSYIPSELLTDSELLGQEFEAITDLNPHGMIRIHGELWQAKLRHPHHSPQNKGTKMRILQREGLLLEVEPANDSNSDDLP